MIRQRIYEYAILFHPEEKKDAAGNVVREKSSLVQAREIPDEYLDKLELVEIVVRPF